MDAARFKALVLAAKSVAKDDENPCGYQSDPSNESMMSLKDARRKIQQESFICVSTHL
jgi:hypothetical protein